MPRSRYDELIALAEENDGLLTAADARQAGFTGSVLARLTQRGRLERTGRGVYRIPYFPPGRFSQYREAVLWAKANRGPDAVALSYATALVVYGISDANPSTIHVTVPRSARLRRRRPKGVIVHQEDLVPSEIVIHEGLPLTKISRIVTDLLKSGGRIGLVQQAISEARREGFINEPETKRLRRQLQERLRTLEAGDAEREPAGS